MPSIAIAKALIKKTKIAGIRPQYEILDGADLLQARLLSEEADIAILPTNLAAILYAKGLAIKYLGTISWGNLYCISCDENVKTLQDLNAKTIYSFAKGMSPDLTLREILSKNSFKLDTDLNFEYLASVSDVAVAFLSGKAKTAIIAEPFLSFVLEKKAETKIVFDLQLEWKKLFSESYPQSCIVARADFIETHKDFISDFLSEVEESINWIKANPYELAENARKFINLDDTTAIVNAIPRLQLYFVNAQKSKKALENYFTILAKTNTKFIGGKMPDEDFYYWFL